MHSRAINCSLCGQRFFPDSMKFHLVACQKKMSFVEVPCYYCEKPFQKGELDKHIQRCKQKQNNLKNTITNNQNKHQTIQQVENTIQSDSILIPCKYCQRKFAYDRILIHQNICKKIKQNRKIFESKKQRLPEEAKLISNISKYKNEKIINIKLKNMRNWKKESENLRKQIQDARKFKIQDKPNQIYMKQQNSSKNNFSKNIQNKSNIQKQHIEKSRIQQKQIFVQGNYYGKQDFKPKIQSSNLTSQDSPFFIQIKK